MDWRRKTQTNNWSNDICYTRTGNYNKLHEEKDPQFLIHRQMSIMQIVRGNRPSHHTRMNDYIKWHNNVEKEV